MIVRKLRDTGVFVSAFLDPELAQIKLAHELGFDAVELHTGTYADAATPMIANEQLARLQARRGGNVCEAGMRLHAGHGLNYRNVTAVARITDMAELNIGHALVSRALFVGMREAVREMKRLLDEAAARRQVPAAVNA